MFDGQTQVMSARGWKPISEITSNNLIAQVNDKNQVSYVYPKVENLHYSGKLYHITGNKGRVDLLLHPKQKLVLEYYLQKTRSRQIKLDTVENEKLVTTRKRIFRSAPNENKGTQLTEGEKLSIIRKNLSFVPRQQYLCANWCKQVIREFFKWHGRFRKPDHLKRMTQPRYQLESIDKELVNTLERVSIAAGYACHVVPHKNGQCMSILEYSTIITGENIQKTPTNYHSYLYKVTVPTGRILIKRNAATAVITA